MRLRITEVGCSGSGTRLMTCAQRSDILYFVLHGMITSGCTQTLGRNQGVVAVAASRCNQGVAAEPDAIVKQQLKPTQSGRSGGIQISFDWTILGKSSSPVQWHETTGLTQNGIKCLFQPFSV